MSSNNIHFGMVTQIFTNENLNSTTNTTNITNIMNYAVGTKVMPFFLNTLNFSRDYDCYMPHTLVINLYPSQGNQSDESEIIYRVCHLFHKMRLVLQISEQTVLQLSLSLLCQLNRVDLHDGKLYIRVPFEAFFNKINMIEIPYSTVSFVLLDAQEISNYSNSFSLITKVYMHDEYERSWISNNNRNNINRNISSSLVQQIGTLYVKVPLQSGSSLAQSSIERRSFQIQTNMLNGSTKGFLIQCSINELTSIKFYINNLLRFDYERYLIQNACIKLSDNLLYMPFNDQTDFLDKGINTFSGAINLSRLQNSILCLQFSSDQSNIVIHNVYYNYLRQTNGLSGLSMDYRPAFIENTTLDHPIQSIIGTPPNTDMLDMSGNYIIGTSSRNSVPSLLDMSGNYVYSSSHGRTGPNYIYTLTTGSTYTPTATYPNINTPISAYGYTPTSASTNTYTNTYTNTPTYTNGSISEIVINYPIPTGSFTFQVINPDRNICNITHDEIAADHQYMTCSNCHIHFLETALKRWLRQRSPATRTCPTCRELWTNFDVYINRVNNGDVD
jgi:hypothetical protein